MPPRRTMLAAALAAASGSCNALSGVDDLRFGAASSPASAGGGGPGGSGGSGAATTGAASSASGAGGGAGGGGGGSPTPICAGGTAALQDDFDDGVAGPEWMALATPGSTIQEVGGELVVTLLPGEELAAGQYHAPHARDLRDCHLLVRAVQVPGVSTPSALGFLYIGSGGPTDYAAIYADGAVLHLVVVVGGASVKVGEIAYDPSEHLWWSIREAAGALSWATSPDGKVWHDRGSVPSPAFVGAVMVGVGGQMVGGGATATARFDDLNLPP